MNTSRAPRRSILILSVLALVALVAVGLHLSRTEAPGTSKAEARGKTARATERPAGPETEAERLAAALRPPTANETPLAAGEPTREGFPRSEELDRLARISGEQIGRRLRIAFDIEEYADGEAAPPFRLIEVSPEAIETLLGLLSSPDAATRRDAAIRLAAARLRAGDLPMLRAALEQEILAAVDQTARHASLAMAYALAAQGERFGTERLETAVLSGERAHDPDFRREAVLVLSMIGDPASSSALREVLVSDPLPGARVHAAQGLGRLGGEDNLAALGGSLGRDDGAEVRAWSALAYGRAASQDGAQADPLWSSSRADAEPIVRAAANYGLSRAGGPGTSAALVEAYHADAETLPRIGVLAGLVKRPNLGRSKQEFVNTAGAEFLNDVARESTDHVALYFTARTLRRIPGETAGAALTTIVTSSHPDWVRNEAVKSLARRDREAALTTLRTQLTVEKRPAVKKTIESEIKRIEKRR